MTVINFVFFILFSCILLITAILSITSRRMIYSLLLAMSVFFCVGLLFLLLGAFYNAMVQFLLYVVAIPILIAVSIMLIKPNNFYVNEVFSKKYIILSNLGILIFVLILAIFLYFNSNVFEIIKDCTLYVNQYSVFVSISQNLLGVYPILLIEFVLCILMTVIGLSYYEK